MIYPEDVLIKPSSKVRQIKQRELRLAKDMIETMYEEEGVGIAAPQVSVGEQIIVVSPTAQPGEEQVYFNPEITDYSNDEEVMSEGCLSLPGVSCEVRRSKKIKLRALDLNGVSMSLELEGFPARVIQHEVDHLHGKLIIDRIDFNRRQLILSGYSPRR